MVQGVDLEIHQHFDFIPDNMAGLNVVTFTFLAVTFLKGGFGVTDEEFQVGYMS